MGVDIFLDYFQAIVVIEAQNTLMQLKIQDFPTMKSGDRSKFFNDIKKVAYPNKTVTTDKLKEIFSLG